ncbi:MAG: hypothetical protein AAGD14_06320 [Planctomycetota bacterium]
MTIDSDEIDGGSWGPGMIRVFLRGTRNRELARVAMPANGEVRVPIRLPDSMVGIRVRVRDSGERVRGDWSARYVMQPIASHERWTSVERVATPSAGIFEIRVPSSPLLLALDAPGAGRTFVHLRPSSVAGDVVEVTVEGSATLEVTGDVGVPVRSLRVSYVRPFEPTSLPENRRVRFIPRTLLGGSGESTMQVRTARARYPRAALLAEIDSSGVAAVSVPSLPSGSIVQVELEDDAGRRATAAAVTGAPGSTTPVALSWGDGRNLDVRVQGPAGRPMRGLIVRLDEQLSGSPRAQLTGVTGAGGLIRLHSLDVAATYTITITDERTTRRFRIPPDVLRGRKSEWTCEFSPGSERSVSAHVRHADGRPAVGFLVSFAIVDGGTIPAMADADGRAVASVPVDERVFAIVNRPYDSSPSLQKEIGPEGSVEITVPSDASGAAATLEMLRGAGVVTVNAWRDDRIVAKQTVFVDGRGVVFFRRLDPGDYRIEAVVGDVSSEVEVKVQAGTQARVHVRVGTP